MKKVSIDATNSSRYNLKLVI